MHVRCRTDRCRNARRSADPRWRRMPSVHSRGISFKGSGSPARSPRRASARPCMSTIWIEGGRLGISSDWIGGRCAPTQATMPTPPIASHRPTTRLQYAILPNRARLLRAGRFLRARRLRDLGRGLPSSSGAGRSSAEACKSGPSSSNVGSRRAFAARFFAAITQPVPCRRIQAPVPENTLSGSI